MDNYLIFKSLHIIFVICWFAGLFYMPRLLIYFTEASEKSEEEKIILQTQFKIMQRRLWYGITWPSCILTIIFGGLMIKNWLPLSSSPWLSIKLSLVVILFLYHLSLGHINKLLQNDIIKYSSTFLRIWNEVSTLFVFSLVFLAVFKDISQMSQALIGLLILMLALAAGIKIYKKIRQ